jgi:molybdopterin synthase catalytic subunit
MNHEWVGGSGPDLVSVGPDPIDVSFLTAFVADPSTGCSILFTGTVRDHSPGREGVTRLDYEAYEGVAEEKIREIIAEARARWQVVRIAAVHRTGSLDLGEVAVAVAVSAGHRSEAFPAARYLIDELKARVPIWKKEHWHGGAEWVAAGE